MIYKRILSGDIFFRLRFRKSRSRHPILQQLIKNLLPLAKSVGKIICAHNFLIRAPINFICLHIKINFKMCQKTGKFDLKNSYFEIQTIYFLTHLLHRFCLQMHSATSVNIITISLSNYQLLD